LIIAAVMARARVTPLHQEMAAGERDEGEIAPLPLQAHPDAELNNCSESRSIFGQSKSTQEEKVKSNESVIEPAWKTSEVQVASSPKGEREDDCLREKLKWFSGLPSLTNLPGFGILLAILCVLWGQAGAVVVKKMTLNPFLLLLWRDLLRLTTQDTPLMLMYGENPFPRGSRILLVIRAIATGVNVAGRTYATRYLPIADVTMIASIRPVCVSLLSCIFLKESCGIFELITLCLVFSGVTLVIQPPFLFGTDQSEYTPHMMHTALMLIVITAISSAVPIVLRHLRGMHWAALGGSARFITIFEHLSVVLFLGLQCLPECGEERMLVLILSVIGTAVQTTQTLSLKYEEAHVISLVDNATNIIVSFLLQAAFFELSMGLLKIVGAGVVLVSVILIGGRQVWRARRTVSQ